MPNRLSLVVLAIALAAAGVAAAQDAGVAAVHNAQFVSGGPCPHCQPEQIVYRDVVTHRCVQVPDKRQIKKTVYEVQEVPFCLPKLPPFLSLFHQQCCDECVECTCPRYKKVLVKKEVVCEEICGTKCVIEEVVERVPCRVCGNPCPQCAATGVPLTTGPIPTPPLPPAK